MYILHVHKKDVAAKNTVADSFGIIIKIKTKYSISMIAFLFENKKKFMQLCKK